MQIKTKHKISRGYTCEEAVHSAFFQQGVLYLKFETFFFFFSSWKLWARSWYVRPFFFSSNLIFKKAFSQGFKLVFSCYYFLFAFTPQNRI
uniref:Pto-like serine/threonine kinase n=1 Tax=Manihot esculenta TaxID=3983 RepID=Q5XNQ0_MANES|nr:Pto-like serine/threonine kinase [Manihot esculenta]